MFGSNRIAAHVSRASAVHVAIAVACSALSPSAHAQTDDEREIIDTLTAMWAAIEAGDIEAYAEFVHPDFTQFGENDVYLAQGKDLEVRGYRDYLSRARDVHTDMHQPEVTIRGDVAWIVYYWTDSGWIGEERFTSRGKSTRIFVKEGGRWLCIHGHYTAVP
ncbi:MAG: nuclear transport factor 2 family protein [Gemmatimonadetes bacterium]|nr:nuclear transport factor 2 family protein [Gemmatimonadota bacterium]